jgi:hypothetical protein
MLIRKIREEFAVADKHQRIVWQIVNVVLPMMPFFLGGGIRLISTQNLDLATFNASDLAICLALLSLSMCQNILNSERVLDNKDKKDEAKSYALIFLLIGIVFLVLFTVIEIYTSSINDPLMSRNDFLISRFTTSLECCKIVTFASTPLVLMFSNKAQKTFRLRSDI